MIQFEMLTKTLLHLMWKPSLPQFFTRYLLQQILAASRAWKQKITSVIELQVETDLRGELLELIRNEMDREGELVDTGLE